MLGKALTYIAAAIAVSLVTSNVAIGQVAPPPKRGSDLEQRAESLRCAIVIIQHENTFGSGFFVSASGDVITASHVLGDRTWSSGNGITTTVSLSMPSKYEVADMDGHNFEVPQSDVDQSPESWGADIAMLHTGHQTKCWLASGDDGGVKAGRHVIALGFPSLAFRSLTLYEGIVSVAHLVSDLPIGKTTQGQAVMPQSEVFRVQMPISPGISGSPLLNDENRVIGVIISAGGWYPDFDALNQFVRIRNQQRSALPPAQANNRDLADLLSEVLDLLHNYDSPGYGDATPMRYLKKAPAANQTPAPTSH